MSCLVIGCFSQNEFSASVVVSMLNSKYPFSMLPVSNVTADWIKDPDFFIIISRRS